MVTQLKMASLIHEIAQIFPPMKNSKIVYHRTVCCTNSLCTDNKNNSLHVPADHWISLDAATLLSSPLSAKISLIVAILLSGKSALNSARASGSYKKKY